MVAVALDFGEAVLGILLVAVLGNSYYWVVAVVTAVAQEEGG